ncbi:MAG: gluconokinase, partial [Mesorhizobium sp.]
MDEKAARAPTGASGLTAVVVMGVAGCGKSALGIALAAALGAVFI